MSRIGRLPVAVPSGRRRHDRRPAGHGEGPEGDAAHTSSPSRSRSRRDDDGALEVTRPDDERESKALHGLSRTLIANMVTGVTAGYTKTLEIVGTGYRVQAQGQRPGVRARASRTRCWSRAPEGITFRVEAPTRFAVEGIDKQKVGEVAANIRKLRKPDPYKGKGVRYQGEVVRRKAGKAGKK